MLGEVSRSSHFTKRFFLPRWCNPLGLKSRIVSVSLVAGTVNFQLNQASGVRQVPAGERRRVSVFTRVADPEFPRCAVSSTFCCAPQNAPRCSGR
jgi:hypothetical protein